MGIEALRTPEENFQDLPGYPFAPNYIENLKGYEGLRIHYLDEGPDKSEEIFLCLHGLPTWSFLYRKMIPVFTAQNIRVIAPDFLGFGKSDKPLDQNVYTFEFHRRMLLRLIKKLDIRNVTLVCQDWGGLLGLTLPMDLSNRFKRLLIMNTALATGDASLSSGFMAWKNWANAHPDMDIARLMRRAVPHLSEAESLAYAAPFPDSTYKAGVRAFPNLVPLSPDDPAAQISQRAQEWFKTKWEGQSFMAVGVQDPVVGPPVMAKLRECIRDCPEPLEIPDAGHFLQEWSTIVASRALKHFDLEYVAPPKKGLLGK